MTHFGLEQIAIILAAASAIAAAVTALWTYAGTALSHRPFVIGEEYREWTELGIEPEVPELGVVGFRLQNEGPGVALEISCRLRSWSHPDIDTYWTPQLGSLSPGAERKSSIPFSVPPGVTTVELGKTEPAPGSSEPDYVLWYAETEFSDIRGVRFTVRTKKAFGSGTAPRRVRSWKVDVWRPQRSDHMRSIWWIDFSSWLAQKRTRMCRGRRRT
jgi:hypothetical protein